MLLPHIKRSVKVPQKYPKEGETVTISAAEYNFLFTHYKVVNEFHDYLHIHRVFNAYKHWLYMKLSPEESEATLKPIIELRRKILSNQSK
jgi:hypothetical protein